MKTIISKLLLIVCVVIVIVVYGFMKGGYDANAVVHEMLEKNDENDVNANMRNVPKMPGSKTLEAYSYSMNDTRVYVRTSETRQGVGAIADYFENEFAALGDVLNGKELEEDGEEFEETGYLKWSGEMQDDITDATLWAIDQGITDRDKICIYGASYGGYATLVGLTKEPQ